MLLKNWQEIFFKELHERNKNRSKEFINQDLKNCIHDTKAFSKEKRMQVYSYAFWVRQVESLEEDYPTLQVIMGKESFRDLLRDYISDLPSTSYTLADLGSRLPLFMQNEKLPLALIELAKFEWSLFQLEYLSSELRPSLEDIENGNIKIKSSLHLHHFCYPITQIYESEELTDKREEYVVVVKNNTIDFFVHEKEEWELLRALKEHSSLEAAIEKAQLDSPERVQKIFQDFMQNGYFTVEALARP